MTLSEPNMIARQWDELFEKMNQKFKKASKNSSKLKIKLRVLGYLIANALRRKI
jgi:hypothetical protein